MRALLIHFEHHPVDQQLQTFQSLSLAADDSSGIVTGNAHADTGTFFLNFEVSIEGEIVKHFRKNLNDLILVLIEFRIFCHFLFFLEIFYLL